LRLTREALRGHGGVAPGAHHCVISLLLGGTEGVVDFLGDVDNHIELGCFLSCWLQVQVNAGIVDPDRSIGVSTVLFACRLARVEVVILLF
jgi:hypothetical protein